MLPQLSARATSRRRPFSFKANLAHKQRSCILITKVRSSPRSLVRPFALQLASHPQSHLLIESIWRWLPIKQQQQQVRPAARECRPSWLVVSRFCLSLFLTSKRAHIVQMCKWAQERRKSLGRALARPGSERSWRWRGKNRKCLGRFTCAGHTTGSA